MDNGNNRGQMGTGQGLLRAFGYGIDEGRVSKLCIGKTDKRDPHKNFFDQMCFNYDRGMDFNKAPAGLLKKIVAELEKYGESLAAEGD